MTLSRILERFKLLITKFEANKRVDIDKPRWDQDTFIGRFKHFWAITNPGHLFHSDKELEYAKDIVSRYRSFAMTVVLPY